MYENSGDVERPLLLPAADAYATKLIIINGKFSTSHNFKVLLILVYTLRKFVFVAFYTFRVCLTKKVSSKFAFRSHSFEILH